MKQDNTTESRIFGAPRRAKQVRAISTELKFLQALENCLVGQSFHATTIDQIANQAGLHRSAFLKRFGSKKGALGVLWQQYCDVALEHAARISDWVPSAPTALDVCVETSVSLEGIQTQYMGSNRAMHEIFMESLKTDPLTKTIFLATVDLMRLVQERFLPTGSFSDTGAFAATQLCTSVNYNYVLRAMPALPRDADTRHQLIGRWMETALTF